MCCTVQVWRAIHCMVVMLALVLLFEYNKWISTGTGDMGQLRYISKLQFIILSIQEDCTPYSLIEQSLISALK